MIRTEITGAEIAEEMEKERRLFQLQMCEVGSRKPGKRFVVGSLLTRAEQLCRTVARCAQYMCNYNCSSLLGKLVGCRLINQQFSARARKICLPFL